MSRLRAAHAGATVRLPKDHGHLALLEGSYTCVRQFAPKVPEAVRFKGGTRGEAADHVFVPGSRRYDNPAAYLFKPAQWETHRTEFCLIGLSTNLGLHGMAASCGIPYDVLSSPLPLVRFELRKHAGAEGVRVTWGRRRAVRSPG